MTYTYEVDLAPGQYEVSIRYHRVNDHATNTPVPIVDDNGVTTLAVTQRENGHDWSWLGVFSFEDTDPLLEISTIGANSVHVVADAILFERFETLPTADLPEDSNVAANVLVDEFDDWLHRFGSTPKHLKSHQDQPEMRQRSRHSNCHKSL